ncbi:MAG: glycosyltransferase 87 family protein [Lachnospiraceae bacterium]|nr:glycosyltransferase 87 family protein [Lachnospiraceae bacterium]
MDEFIKWLWDRKAVRYAVIVILAGMALISLIQGIKNAAEFSQDFQWDAAKAFTLKMNPYDESMHPGTYPDASVFRDHYLQMEANQFPSLLMLLIPYTFFPPLAARYAWIVSNLVFTAGIVILLRKTFLKDADRDVFIAFMLLMIAGTPYRNQLGVGQHTLFAFFFFLLAVWFEGMYPDSIGDTDKKKVPALFAAVVICLFICYFKYTLTVPLCLYFVYKKRYPEIVVSALMHLILTAVSAFWLHDSFINMIIKPLKVSSALSGEGGLDFGVLLKGSPIAYVLALIVMAFLFVLSLKLEKGAEGALISVLILWSMIITYHRTYDFFVIVAVLAFFLERERPVWLRAGYLAVILAVFFVLRVFSESPASKAAVGALYYIFTMAVTVFAIKKGADRTPAAK